MGGWARLVGCIAFGLLACVPAAFASASATNPASPPQAAPAAEAAPAASQGDPRAVVVRTPMTVGWVKFLIVAMYALTVLGALIVAARVGPDWRLGDAVSEEVEISIKDDPEKKETVLRASSSRLIALLALIMMLAFYLGVAAVVLWNLGLTGTVPDLGSITTFLLAGAGLFIPYGVNQFRAAIASR